MINGHCECGRVQFEIDDDISDFSHCHCSQCRRLHGAAFGTFAGVSRNKFSYTAGQDALKSYASSAASERLFCKVCGSNILVDVKTDADHLYVCMGVVNGNPRCPTGYHQFVGSRAPWHEITDSLMQFDEWAPDD